MVGPMAFRSFVTIAIVVDPQMVEYVHIKYKEC